MEQDKEVGGVFYVLFVLAFIIVLSIVLYTSPDVSILYKWPQGITGIRGLEHIVGVFSFIYGIIALTVLSIMVVMMILAGITGGIIELGKVVLKKLGWIK